IESRKCEVREDWRCRRLAPLVKNIAEAQFVKQDLLDGILSNALCHRPLIQKSPHRRSVSVVGDELLDLTQISCVTSVDRAKHDAGGQGLLRPPCLAYGPRDDHAGGSLRAEIEIEDQVLYLVGNGRVDRLFWGAHIEEFGTGPALVNPGA